MIQTQKRNCLSRACTTEFGGPIVDEDGRGLFKGELPWGRVRCDG